jgi:small conductance mechanosensitive channel
MDVSKTMQTIIDVGIVVGFKVAGAIVFWLIGRWLIALAVRLVSSALERQKVDPTLLRYIGTIISVTLNIILVVAILGYFGVETTSFAAAGVAIGMAHYWQVYFDTNRVIRETFGAAGYPVPEQHFVIRNPS